MIEHIRFFALGRILTTMMDPDYLNLAEISAIKVEKIYFPKTRLACLALKLFLYRINSTKAPKRTVMSTSTLFKFMNSELRSNKTPIHDDFTISRI